MLVCVRVRARGFRVLLPLRGFGRWTLFVDSAELLRLAKRAFVDSFVKQLQVQITADAWIRWLTRCGTLCAAGDVVQVCKSVGNVSLVIPL